MAILSGTGAQSAFDEWASRLSQAGHLKIVDGGVVDNLVWFELGRPNEAVSIPPPPALDVGVTAELRITSDRNQIGNNLPTESEVWPVGSVIKLRGGQLEIAGDLDDLTFVGAGNLKVGGWVLSNCEFTASDGEAPRIEFVGHGVLLHALGQASVNFGDYSPSIVGAEEGFEILSMDGSKRDGQGELDNVIITRLVDRHLQSLVGLKRLLIGWPRRTNNSIDRRRAVASAFDEHASW